MRLREGQMPEDNGGAGSPAGSRPVGSGSAGAGSVGSGSVGSASAGAGSPGPVAGSGSAEGSGPVVVRFRASRVRAGLALAGAVVFGLLAVLADDRVHVLVAVLLVAGLVGYGMRDLLAPVRLAAGPDGLTVVTGYAGHRLLPWAAVERIRVDRRARLGLRSELLEVDTGDNLYLFSATDLGTPCQEAADRLRALRTGR